jgi:hypothetical protein
LGSGGPGAGSTSCRGLSHFHKHLPIGQLPSARHEYRPPGRTPLEIMRENMRWAHQEAAELLAKLLPRGAPTGPEGLESFKQLLRLRELAGEWAKDAAPYVHPLSSLSRHRPSCARLRAISVTDF